MKHWTDADRQAARRLQTLPNVGAATADDLLRLGVRTVEDLARQDARSLWERLWALDGVRHDPCVEDVFASAISAARGEPPHPWWEFTRRRKLRESARRA